MKGAIPAATVDQTVRPYFGRFRGCYELGLQHNPKLRGTVSTRFVIDAKGAVTSVTNAGSDLRDAFVVKCVATGFEGIAFPAPEAGTVTVVYPIELQPPD